MGKFGAHMYSKRTLVLKSSPVVSDNTLTFLPWLRSCFFKRKPVFHMTPSSAPGLQRKGVSSLSIPVRFSGSHKAGYAAKCSPKAVQNPLCTSPASPPTVSWGSYPCFLMGQAHQSLLTSLTSSLPFKSQLKLYLLMLTTEAHQPSVSELW